MAEDKTQTLKDKIARLNDEREVLITGYNCTVSYSRARTVAERMLNEKNRECEAAEAELKAAEAQAERDASNAAELAAAKARIAEQARNEALIMDAYRKQVEEYAQKVRDEAAWFALKAKVDRQVAEVLRVCDRVKDQAANIKLPYDYFETPKSAAEKHAEFAEKHQPNLREELKKRWADYWAKQVDDAMLAAAMGAPPAPKPTTTTRTYKFNPNTVRTALNSLGMNIPADAKLRFNIHDFGNVLEVTITETKS